MTLLMIFCIAHKAYTATDRNFWGGHGRGGKGASGHLEISHGSGPYRAISKHQCSPQGNIEAGRRDKSMHNDWPNAQRRLSIRSPVYSF